MGPGIGRDSGPRAPISKRVIIEDRKTDRDPMLPAFHVDGDLHNILHPARYPGKSRRPRSVKGVRGVQFEACIGFDATFPESVIIRDDDYLVRGVAKAQLAELLSGDILRGYGLGNAACKRGCQPKETQSDGGAHLVPPLKDPGTPVLAVEYSTKRAIGATHRGNEQIIASDSIPSDRAPDRASGFDQTGALLDPIANFVKLVATIEPWSGDWLDLPHGDFHLLFFASFPGALRGGPILLQKSF